MAHPFIEKYLSLMAEGTPPDPEEIRGFVTDDVRWHEAGSPDVLTGADAVIQRLSTMGGDATVDVRIDGAVGDDDHAAVMGHATFEGGGQKLEYDFVEFYKLRDGKLAERWSFMDALPDDVKAFFG